MIDLHGTGRFDGPFGDPPPRRSKTVKDETAADKAEKAYVRGRDKGCVAQAVIGLSKDYWKVVKCEGRLEVDHVRASGGLGIKSATHRSNMVLLCHWHHRLKTEYGRVWRPLLLAYLERVGER